MPIYTFVCSSCGHQFDKLVRKMETKTETCPECGMESNRGIEVPAKFQWGKSGGW